METKFRLKRSATQDNGYTYLLTEIKLATDDHWFKVNERVSYTEFPPFFRQAVDKTLSTRIRKQKVTLTKALTLDQLSAFRRDGRFVIKDKVLSTVSAAQPNEKIDQRERKLKGLKFEPGKDDALKFREAFLDIFANDEDSTMGKLALIDYYLPCDDEEFRREMNLGKSLDSLLDLFVQKYQVLREEKLEQLRLVTLASCGNEPEQLILKKLEAYAAFQSGLPFKTKLKMLSIDPQLPDNYKAVMMNMKTETLRLCNTPEKLICYLRDKLNPLPAQEPVAADDERFNLRFNRPEL